MFILHLNLAAVVSIVFASTLFFPIQEMEAERKWTDESGSFAVTAKLLSADATSVTLKKSNGATVTVPLNKLSAESKAYVLAYLSKQQPSADNASPPAATAEASEQKDSKSQLDDSDSEESGAYPLLGRMPPPALADYGSIKKAEPQLLYATKIVDAYQQLLKQKNLDDFSRTNAEKRILEVEPYVSRNAVLVNSTFQTVDEILANDQKAEQLIAESFAIGRKGDAEKWIKKLNEAAGANPTSPHANYLLGLGHAARLRNFETATRNFKEAIERADTFAPILNNAALRIRNGALNNIAIAKFRDGKPNESCRYWQQIELAGDPLGSTYKANILHAVGYLKAAENKRIGYVKVPNANAVKCYQGLLETHAHAKIEGGGQGERGWRFVEYTPHRDGVTPLDESVINLRDLACLNCQGRGTVACRACVNGAVGRSRIERVEIPTGYIDREIKWSERCANCGGKAVVDCGACQNGEEIFPGN